MAKNDTRLNRINEELKKEISHVLTFELKNPNVTGLLSVTRFSRFYKKPSRQNC